MWDCSFSVFAVWVDWPERSLRCRCIHDKEPQPLWWATWEVLPVSSTRQVGQTQWNASCGCLCAPPSWTWNCETVYLSDTERKTGTRLVPCVCVTNNLCWIVIYANVHLRALACRQGNQSDSEWLGANFGPFSQYTTYSELKVFNLSVVSQTFNY